MIAPGNNLQQPSYPSNKNSVLNKIFYGIVLTLLLSLLVGLGVYFFIFNSKPLEDKLGSNQSTNIQSDTDSEGISTQISSKWQKPVSNKKALVFNAFRANNTDNTTIQYILYPETGKYETLEGKINSLWGTFSSGFGDSEGKTSPDLKYTAYLDKNDETLKLLNHENLSSIQITNYPVMFITDWTKDSSKIIYYLGENDIDVGAEYGPDYMGPGPTTVDFSKNTKPGGFYSFDINTGAESYLYPLNRIDAVIDGNRVLTQSQTNSSYVVFDLDKFVADYILLKNVPGYNNDLAYAQFDFTADGSKWTYNYSANPTDDASIMFGDFPATPKKNPNQVVTIASGEWGDFNFPLWMNDGKTIIYTKEDAGSNPVGKVAVYDIATKQTKTYLNYVNSYYKVGEDKLLVKTLYGSNLNFSDYILFDVNTGQSQKLFTTEYKN